jgi:parvulin-like peptidyl-prolyl isomerase
MLSWIREKFGTVVIGGIITFIAFVFVFYGVFSPKSTRGLHEGSVAGTVNGDAISIPDFNRELNRRIEFFKNIGGGKITDEQLKAFHVREGVFQELANRKLMSQEAKRQGLMASDEEVKQKIQEVPAFQKDGKFDLATYKQVLEANRYSPGSFEKMVREDASLQQWESYFKDRVRVGEEEVKREFSLTQDKRNIKYVVLTTESAKKSIEVDSEAIQKFLADPAKVNLAKMKFEEGKGQLYKGQKFDAVKESIARNILAGEKTEELQKANLKLADQIVASLKADSSSDAKVNSLLKSSGVQVKTTGMITQQSGYTPGIGEAKELMKDAFATQSPIDSHQGGKPKKYILAGRVLVALVVDSQKPDATKLAQERIALIRQISSRKARDLYQEWMKKISSKAKIDMNPAVVGADS